ncbi:PREDICTED: inosine-uridine preferring nucleoside hydrolase-like [Priapulus caudatus]|uniref:Inosine-uridine preferring nucleoside hydrolase-like n=1 Tax=Priapulus caudatus TaxID=37621 RepID=A0ABM1EU63_PRICU|nr:PREDICTED: inosine-uridine preferring nucleoside hydrolase-like [Priapulus caudatus]
MPVVGLCCHSARKRFSPVIIMASTDKQLFILDVDTGVDDAQAIMLALSQPTTCHLLAITCVAGNTSLDNVCLNTLRVLKVCDRLDVPVYRGCHEPIIGTPTESPHGSDGHGGLENPESVDINLIKKEHAIHALIRLVTEHPNEITLVALAPLTNVALAHKIDTTFSSKLKRLIIMGGNTEGHGNVKGLAAEYNFLSDPEAAFIVLDGFQCPITLIGWEVCQNSWVPWMDYYRRMNADTPKARLLQSVSRYHLQWHKDLDRPRYVACDSLATALAINADVVTKREDVYARVELRGEITRGQMVCDWKRLLEKKPNVDVVLEIDVARAGEMLDQMLM